MERALAQGTGLCTAEGGGAVRSVVSAVGGEGLRRFESGAERLAVMELGSVEDGG